MLIYSKLHSKSCDYLYETISVASGPFSAHVCAESFSFPMQWDSQPIALRVLSNLLKYLKLKLFDRTYNEYLLCKSVSCSRITLYLRFRPFLWHHYSMPTNAVIIRICIAACDRSIAGKRFSKLTLRNSDETRKMSTRLVIAVTIVLLLAAIPFTWTQGPG